MIYYYMVLDLITVKVVEDSDSFMLILFFFLCSCDKTGHKSGLLCFKISIFLHRSCCYVSPSFLW